MPELPEVESVKVGLNQLVVERTIAEIDCFWPRIIETDQSIETWCRSLENQTIHFIGRRGKYLIFYLDDVVLISHLRMEGKYLFYQPQEVPLEKSKHTHLIFTFKDGSQLHYHDVRKFGRIRCCLMDQYQEYFIKKKLGPEPLSSDFDFLTFYQGLSKIQRPIKSLLLDQRLVVGLGNIYVDESLFQAKILPTRSASSLTEFEVTQLYHAIRQILARAVEAGGSTIRTYKNSLGQAGKFQLSLNVYGREGQACPECGHDIYKIKLGQRGTHYCPQCQK